MNEMKTGALVCKSPDSNNQFTYKPLAFITGIPGGYSDEDFKRNFDLSMVSELTGNCDEILFRADIHSTSNEVQEAFEDLHHDKGKFPEFHFRQKTISV